MASVNWIWTFWKQDNILCSKIVVACHGSSSVFSGLTLAKCYIMCLALVLIHSTGRIDTYFSSAHGQSHVPWYLRP